MIDFLSTLFWLPLNSLYVIVNLGLWALFVWLIIEAIKHLVNRYAD